MTEEYTPALESNPYRPPAALPSPINLNFGFMMLRQ